MMKKVITLFMLALAFSAQVLHAADKNKTLSFWDVLRIKIESLTPQKKSTVTTATGGVRGASVTSDDVYWKNEATAQMIAGAELEAFSKAVKLADTDNKEQAKIAFSEFIKQYPKSALRSDADQALVQLQPASAPAPAQ